MARWSEIKKKAKAIWKVFRADCVTFSTILAPKDQIKALVGAALREKMKPGNPSQDLFVSEATELVYSRLTLPPEKAFHEKFELVVDGIGSIGLFNFYNLAGVAAVWEHDVRLIASRLGVEIKVPKESRSKRARRKGAIALRFVEDILPELEAKTGERLAINQRRLLDLRNSIAHANFQELRVKATGGLARFPDEYRGNVVVGALQFVKGQEPANSVRNLSNLKKEEDVEDEDIFGWLLEATNSRMLHDLHDEYIKAIGQIRLLVAFNSMSFNGRRPLFEKVVFRGEKLTLAEVQEYQDYFNSSAGMHLGTNAVAFINGVYECFTGLK